MEKVHIDSLLFLFLIYIFLYNTLYQFLVSNYSEINHNPPREAPLKSSLKPSSNLWRGSAPITSSTKRPERYPSPPSSPSPPPPPRLSSSSMTQLQTPNDSKLSELQFPPPPTELGRFRETITKNTMTETVVTRLTSNQKGQRPVITEVFSFS